MKATVTTLVAKGAMPPRATVLAFLSMLFISSASALEPHSEPWTDPEHVLSLDVTTSGWQVADRSQHPDWFFDDFLLLAYSGLEGSTPRNICNVKVHNRMLMPVQLSRMSMNQRTHQLLNSPTTEQMRHDPQLRVERIEVVDVDGVSTLDVYGRFMSLDTVTRRFFIQRNGEIRMYAMSCSVEASDPQAVEGAHAIAASLHFLGTADQ